MDASHSGVSAGAGPATGFFDNGCSVDMTTPQWRESEQAEVLSGAWAIRTGRRVLPARTTPVPGSPGRSGPAEPEGWLARRAGVRMLTLPACIVSGPEAHSQRLCTAPFSWRPTRAHRRPAIRSSVPERSHERSHNGPAVGRSVDSGRSSWSECCAR
nr:hypothetical protein KPHV_72180 [Kitasatospora purpeofusca]